MFSERELLNCMFTVPGAREAEAEESLEPRSLRSTWVRPCLKTKKKTEKELFVQTGDVAHTVQQPQFKPQYHEKKKKRIICLLKPVRPRDNVSCSADRPRPL
jgi:hypothetical protein